VRRRLFPNTFWGLVEEIFSGDDEFSSAGEVIVSILSFSWFVGRTCGAFPFFPFFGLGKAQEFAGIFFFPGRLYQGVHCGPAQHLQVNNRERN